MKITRKQLRKLIRETNRQESTPEDKLMMLMKSGMEGLRQSEDLAKQLGIDLFPIFVKFYLVRDAILTPFINEKDLTDLIYRVGDNSLYDAGFFPTLIDVFPNFKSLSLGMSSNNILELINNDEEENIYGDADMGLGMAYQRTLESGGGIRAMLKDWIIAIWFLKLDSIKRMKGENFILSEEIERMFPQ
tara:strand:+ start:312 stop:878 length:567 start_codon:yes stop_codon:yes gene_type:complete